MERENKMKLLYFLSIFVIAQVFIATHVNAMGADEENKHVVAIARSSAADVEAKNKLRRQLVETMWMIEKNPPGDVLFMCFLKVPFKKLMNC